MSKENARKDFEISFTTSRNVYMNTESDYIVITEDKVKLILKDYSDDLEKKKEWHTPCGVFVTIFAILVTTNFDSDYRKFGFSADNWTSVFLVGAVLSLCWLVRNACMAIRAKSPKNIVEEFKAQAKLIKGAN